MENSKPADYQVKEADEYDIVNCVEEQAEPSKYGPKPKRLVAAEVFGYEIGRGLNRRVVVPSEIYKLAAIGLTDRDIARWFEVKEDTLRYHFSDILAKGREDLKISLRRAQLKVALGGNATMLIWLGKNILGQQENPTNADATKILPWSDGDDDGVE